MSLYSDLCVYAVFVCHKKVRKVREMTLIILSTSYLPCSIFDEKNNVVASYMYVTFVATI